MMVPFAAFGRCKFHANVALCGVRTLEYHGSAIGPPNKHHSVSSGLGAGEAQSVREVAIKLQHIDGLGGGGFEFPLRRTVSAVKARQSKVTAVPSGSELSNTGFFAASSGQER